jgi:hypothetical protein
MLWPADFTCPWCRRQPGAIIRVVYEDMSPAERALAAPYEEEQDAG